MLPWVEREREPLRWLRLVAAIGVAEAGTQFDLPVSPIGRERLTQLLPPADGRPRVGLHVGARDPARRWPAAAFATVADVLIDRCDAHIILTGAIDERVLTADVRGRMRGDAVDRAGETTLDELAAVVASLDLLITNDTGVSHVAAATRTRSIVLFGPTRPERWAPLDQELHTAIDATQGVAEVNRAAALRDLPPETVIEAAWAALGLGAAARESSLESEWVACAG
jgi:ADP-heptose:LPS heptosyltransferase